MLTYFYIIQIIVAIALIVLVLLQARGGSLGGIFGGSDGGVYKTRRGIEKTMFQATIVLSALFFIVAIATVLVAG